MTTLFDPLRLGDFEIASRIVMAPLTRNRAPQQTPNALMAEYYAQRADPATGAGLIITEASQISPQGQGYLDTPGCFNAAQVQGWRRVTEAVHARGGRIVIQLWHVGRISHVSLLPGGAAPVSSTTTPARTKTFVQGGFADVSAPRALATDELPAIVADYAHAARCAMEAGFDGVEIHAANGYLIEQFLRDSINDRRDAYGGDLSGRTRLLREVMAAVTTAIGAGRTAIRLSPVTPANDAGQDSDPAALYGAVVQHLAGLGLSYIHVVEGSTGGPRDNAVFDWAALRAQAGATPWLVNNGYSADMAQAAVAQGRADAIAFGRPFIANPDLAARLRRGLPWASLQRETLYGGSAAGYTDYPVAAG